MAKEDFIFTPGLWLGEGKISFSASHEFLKFYTKWEITEETPGIMTAVQVVEMQGVEEKVVNVFTFKDITPTSFTVLLENNVIGSMTGTGLRNEHVIAWEFRGQTAFEGFEVYEQQESGDYFLHAEYGSSDQFRTIVEGLIWRKGS
jgi:hypothetical protein